jgi:hypothetical protein
MILREIKNMYVSNLQQIYQNKLIEGVDYQTYDWLKANIPPNVRMMNLPVNSNNVEYDLQRLALKNTTIFNTKNDEYAYFFWQNRYVIGVYDIKRERDITSKSYDSTISLFHIKTTSNSVAFNSVNIGAFGLPITNILWHVVPASTSDTTKTSSIKVDGVTRYVPCQLIRSIPRNLDAQCKERVAGDCGMIDLKTRKFYGNMASSGTFTVENDNNE